MKSSSRSSGKPIWLYPNIEPDGQTLRLYPQDDRLQHATRSANDQGLLLAAAQALAHWLQSAASALQLPEVMAEARVLLQMFAHEQQGDKHSPIAKVAEADF